MQGLHSKYQNRLHLLITFVKIFDNLRLPFELGVEDAEQFVRASAVAGLPWRVLPGGRLKITRNCWKKTSPELNGGWHISGKFLLALGIEFDLDPSLQQDLQALLRENKFGDFKLKCGEEEFHCHKSILAARSPVLSDAFTFSSDDGQHEIKRFNPSTLKQVLDLLYSGKVTRDITELADYLGVDDEQIREQLPELRPYHTGYSILALKETQQWLTLAHSGRVQVDPCLLGKVVNMSWTIPDFENWRVARPNNHIERSPEVRFNLWGKEFVFTFELHLDQLPGPLVGPDWLLRFIRLISNSNRQRSEYLEKLVGIISKLVGTYFNTI